MRYVACPLPEKKDVKICLQVYPRKQATDNALASQWISLKDEIKADFAGAQSDVHGVLEQI